MLVWFIELIISLILKWKWDHSTELLLLYIYIHSYCKVYVMTRLCLQEPYAHLGNDPTDSSTGWKGELLYWYTVITVMNCGILNTVQLLLFRLFFFWFDYWFLFSLEYWIVVYICLNCEPGQIEWLSRIR